LRKPRALAPAAGHVYHDARSISSGTAARRRHNEQRRPGSGDVRLADSDLALRTHSRPLTRVQRAPARDGHVVTYFFPGTWMDDADLERLRGELEGVARDRLGVVPAYGVFLPGRMPYANRIVTLLYRRDGEPPLGFSAMVHCPVVHAGEAIDVLNLGLAVTRQSAARMAPLWPLYMQPLRRYYTDRAFRAFWIGAFTAKPLAIGAIADTFSEVHPNYRRPATPDALQLAIARRFFGQWRGESGVGADAAFDEASFVVRAGTDEPSAPLRRRFAELPMSRVAAANEFCRRTLDHDRGDELLMVGKLDGWAVLRALRWRLAPRG
jgi:hypothetical protein